MNGIKSSWATRSRWVLALLTAAGVCALATVVNVQATTRHAPPWADNFHFDYSDPRLPSGLNYTLEAATSAKIRQSSIGYYAGDVLNTTAGNMGYYMQNDAVWSAYTHGSRDFIVGDDPGEALWKDTIRGYDLSGLKLAVFFSCYSAQPPDDYHITRAAVYAGAGAALGFYDQVSGWHTPVLSPQNQWSVGFWDAMKGGSTVYQAGLQARDRVRAICGTYSGTDQFSIWGNSSQTITPADYK